MKNQKYLYEDVEHLFKHALPENFNQEQSGKESLKGKRQLAGWDESYFERIIFREKAITLATPQTVTLSPCHPLTTIPPCTSSYPTKTPTSTMSSPDTQVIALLQENDVPFRLLPHKEPVFTVSTAAAQRGVVKEEMVKSILLKEKSGQRRYVMACVLGEARLDPKAVRHQLPADWRRLSFASTAQIQAVTGYIQGAVAPLCLPENVPVIFDEAIVHCQKVNISSGDPMAGLELDPQDLIRLAGAQLAPIVEKNSA